MTQRIALLADIHGNSPALRAVLDDIQHTGCGEVLMLGDIINGFDPGGCVRALRGWADRRGVALTCIRGNAEAYLATPDRAALPRQDLTWNREIIALAAWWEAHLTAEEVAWACGLPESLRWRDALLVHDSPLDRITVQTRADPDVPAKYREWFFHGRGISLATDEATWQRLFAHMADAGLGALFCGHTHEAFYRERAGALICNVGSAGMPLDGDPRPAWVLLEADAAGKQALTIRRVSYDIALIHELIDATPDYPSIRAIPGFGEAYKQGLTTGRHWRLHLPAGG